VPQPYRKLAWAV